MKKPLFIVCMVLAGAAGGLAADPVDEMPVDQPSRSQFFLNVDGLGGVQSEPVARRGDSLWGGEAGFEYIPVPVLGLDADYDYLLVDKAANDRDNDIDLSLRLIAPLGAVSLWLQGGVGENRTANPVNGHWLGFAGPGLRVALGTRVAFDLGVRYMLMSPLRSPNESAPQAWLGMAGFSIALDGD